MAALAIMALGRTSLNLSAQWDQHPPITWPGRVWSASYFNGQPSATSPTCSSGGRRGTLAATSVLVVLGILVAVNYIGKQQNKRWDLTENKQFSLSDQSRDVVLKLDAPVEILGFLPADQMVTVNTFRDLLMRRPVESDQAGTDRPDRNPSVPPRTKCAATVRSSSATRAGPNASRPRRNRRLPMRSSRSSAARRATCTSPRATARRIRRRAKLAVHGRVGSLKRENYTVEKLVLAQQARAGQRHDGRRRGSAHRLPARRGRNARVPGEGRQAPARARCAGASDESPLPNLTGLAKKWGIDVGNNLVIDRQA